ncbi:MAG: hypothetical protein GX361_01035 [Bacteroidales bacterium]|nr:hypothetical protein [Bacteroidales bacterium]
MNNTFGILDILPTLSTITWSVDRFKYNWKWSDRSMERLLKRFIDLNCEALDFLGITPTISTLNGKVALQVTTSGYVGSIPIKSPVNGKLETDLIVTGRYGEDVSGLISLLGDRFQLDYSDRLILVNDTQIKPPIFLECCKYIDLFLAAEKTKWRKFSNQIINSDQPNASTIWSEYALRVAESPQTLSYFKNKENFLTTNHEEWVLLVNILGLAISNLKSASVPYHIRSAYSSKIRYLNHRYRFSRNIVDSPFKIRKLDPLSIQKLKEKANILIQGKSKEKIAWRLDYTLLFEYYVQYLFNEVAKRKGAVSVNNPKYSVYWESRPAWALKYLEPDLVLKKGYAQIIIDAKYKSHLYNYGANSEELYETFRHDLHQILAYSSLTNVSPKQVVMVYPSKELIFSNAVIINPSSQVEITLSIVGIPISKDQVNNIVSTITNIIHF